MSEENKDNRSFLQKIEKEFDWNLIALVSVWIFMLTTFFLIFVG
ncbi:MAG: hypothetical protein ACD_39C01044G0002 [uncultured bacterium]|nr:MAG: hypothetical protein ACD_39C01044G0002 [uncultured bacterium]